MSAVRGFLISIFLFHIALSLDHNAPRSLTIGYAVPYTKGWPIGAHMAPAIFEGIREVQRRHLLDGINIKWTWRDTWCQPLQAMRMAVDMRSKSDRLDVLIGEGCSSACQPVALLAAAWSVPFVSMGCISPKLSDQQTFPTFSRVIGTSAATGSAYSGIANLFEWDRVAIIYDTNDIYRSMADSTNRAMEESGKKVFMRSIANTMNGQEIIQKNYDILVKVIHDLQRVTRVFYLFLYDQDMRNSLIIAKDRGMMNGEYAFIGSAIGPEIQAAYSYRPEIGPEIYEGVLNRDSMAPAGERWNNFAAQVLNDFDKPEFAGMPHPPVNATTEFINVYAGLVHDAVLAWAYGVNKTLSQNLSVDDGFAITRNIYGLTFDGITGEVTTDQKGERKPNYKIEIVQSGKLVKIMEWNAAKNKMEKVYKPEDANDWTGLKWPGNADVPPSGKVQCGWNGEFCQKKDNGDTTLMTVVPIVICLAVIVCITSLAFYIKRRRDEDIREVLACCFSWDEIEHLDHKRATSRVSLQSSANTGNGQIFSELGRVRGEVAAIKKLGIYPITMTEQVKKELRAMINMQHENVNAFLGVCLEASHVCVLMAYVSRGSLQDVIAQSEFAITWELKISIVNDLAHGMNYIHKSALGYHGHLSSSNCVIDSRWTCKVTDYGAKTLKKASGLGKNGDASPQHPLWTAPEILRVTSDVDNKAADVYSFGIILQEVILEDEPYAMNYFGTCINAEEIVEKVKNGQPVFRPIIPTGSCDSKWETLMQLCWDEEPDLRPSFKMVIGRIQQLNNGRAFTLVDSLIKRLEHHTGHLEAIVAKRSLELEEEKLKMELLLSELLPVSVTANLKLGCKVEPEAFDEVTVMFCDIVSFTNFASNCTPLEVVKVLNIIYTVFDDVTTKHDVYKLATIGDSYFVASGVPIRNGNKHAEEIANMALDLMEASKKGDIVSSSKNIIEFRIGIHTGPCVAGVTGIKMPRYLLFGETVNTAAKVESSGEPMKIQISETTANILRVLKSYVLEYANSIVLKDSEEINTYWLLGAA